jgi:hypothetical protein
MKCTLYLLLACIILAGLVLPGVVQSQVKVTFIINSSTAPDTVNAAYDVRVTGASAGLPNSADGSIPRVDTLMTRFGAGLKASSIGGDYWKLTVSFQPKDSVRFKFRINGDWEDNSTDPNGFSTDNRGVRVGFADTTLPVMYYNKTGSTQPQYRTPWTAAPDSFMNVYFRTDMQGYAQNSVLGATDTLGVRGGGHMMNADFNTPELAWGTTSYLTKGSGSMNGYDGTNFWAGRVRIRKSTVNPGDSLYYKFIINSDWGRADNSNRLFIVPTGRNDTTLSWKWFQDIKPIGRPNLDTAFITFTTNMAHAVAKGGFKNGDTLVVQSGFFGTAAESPRERRLSRQGLTNLYKYTDTIVTSVGKPLDYQYYWKKNALNVRENYFNFQYTGTVSAEQEKRQFLVPNKNFTINDTVNGVSDARRQPEFADQSKLSQAVKVTWIVDMRPAYYQVWAGDSLVAGQGTATVRYVDSIKAWGVAINGPATGGVNGPLAVDWSSWDKPLVADTSQKKMWDNGTHGDTHINDTLYTVQFNYTTANTKGVTFKFGIQGSDNESGFGLNHLENIDDSSPTFTINAQWGSINPNFYKNWDYDLHKPKKPTSVQTTPGVARVYSLEQNYPNPFNPSTKINFSLPEQSNVELVVFNVLGQKVATLVNESLKAGNHSVTFDASKISSGVYFYRIDAGRFTSTKKMLFMK